MSVEGRRRVLVVAGLGLTPSHRVALMAMSEIEIIGGPPRTSLTEIRKVVERWVPETPALQVVVFGSYARAAADCLSDIDLCIVAPSGRPFPDRFLDFLPLLDHLGAAQVIVYTPEEWAELKRDPNAFIDAILREGIVLYERS